MIQRINEKGQAEAVAIFIIMLIVGIVCIMAGVSDSKVAHPRGLIAIGVFIVLCVSGFIAFIVITSKN